MGPAFLLSNLEYACPRKQASASLGNRGGFVFAPLARVAPAAESARGIEGVGTKVSTSDFQNGEKKE